MAKSSILPCSQATSRAHAFKSVTNFRYSARLSASSSIRRMYEGWIVASMRPPSGSDIIRPRILLIANGRPETLRTAVAPNATTMSGRMIVRSRSSQKRQRSISYALGRLCRRRFPRNSNLKCLTALVTKTILRSFQASANAVARTPPAGPTNGLPGLSA